MASIIGDVHFNRLCDWSSGYRGLTRSSRLVVSTISARFCQLSSSQLVASKTPVHPHNSIPSDFNFRKVFICSFLPADRNVDRCSRCLSPFRLALLSIKNGLLKVCQKSLKTRIRSPNCRSCSMHFLTTRKQVLYFITLAPCSCCEN